MTETKLPEINIGIVGHVDHGKTTLTYGITGKWTMAHSEELKRGITIKLGYADADIQKCSKCGAYTFETQAEPRFGGAQPKQVLARETCKCGGKAELVRKISIVDAPGHETLMAVMLAGAAIIDGAILVISANEPVPQPQTAEHLMALKVLGIKNIIVVQNKIDSITKEKAKENYEQIKKFVAETYGSELPIIPISAKQGINLEKILEFLCKIEIKKPQEGVNPIFYIARSFDINKPGTKIEDLHGGILGGALKQGVLRIGDKIEIKPGYSYKKHNTYEYKTLKSKIISMKKGDYSITEAKPGGSLAIETELDPTLSKADALSGSVASLEGVLSQISESIKIDYELFNEVLGTGKHESVGELKINEMLMISLNTSITVGQIKKIDKNSMELSLKIPIVPFRGDSLGIARNLNGHWRLIGFGEIQ